MLTRDSLRDGHFLRMLELGRAGWRTLGEEELRESRQRLLARLGPGEPVWIFGYGSLMWNPAFRFDETRVGTLYGYHRRFCLWTTLGRGSPDYPGLMLGLERGGCCHGLAMRIAPGEVATETDIVWRREMLRGAYDPRLVRIHCEDSVVRAVAFVINHRHEAYAGMLPEDTVVARLAKARGPLGACAEYLANTVDHLEELGLRDPHMTRLRNRVQRLSEGAGGAG